jgi:hypothetical protein
MSRDSYGRICRAGVLAVSPPDECEMPDEYIDRARAELLSDNDWIADQIAESVDALVAEMLMDTEHAIDAERDRAVCERLRAAVNAAIEREVPDLAESMWMADVEESQIAAAEYAADCSNDDY